MLSRTAENLYWISRYMERAEHTARLVGMACRMVGPKNSSGTPQSEWHSVLESLGSLHQFGPGDSDFSQSSVARFLILDTNNPSSVASCFERARHNARRNRVAISSEVWDVINGSWREIRSVSGDLTFDSSLPTLLDNIARNTALYRGTIDGTILRDDRYDFLQLGVMTERADNIARLIDVCNERETQSQNLSENLKTHHWMTALHATSSVRAFYALYKDDVSAERIADFYISNKTNPRSLQFCILSIAACIQRLEASYSSPPSCRGDVEALMSFVQAHAGAERDTSTLGDFLARFIELNAALSDQIASTFWFQDAAGLEGA